MPLTYDGEYPSLKIKRAIVYNKGALFMDAIRKQLGDEAFWKGFRIYTTSYMGKTVETRDFQKQMEKASGQNLSALFKQWAY